MSSTELINGQGLFATFLAVHHPISEDDATEKPAETPQEPTKSMWQAGGYVPQRASWHTVRGRIKSYLA